MVCLDDLRVSADRQWAVSCVGLRSPGRSILLGLILLAFSCSPPLDLPRGASWDEQSSTFKWWGGEIRLPAGFRYQVDQGTDSFMGHFTAADGRVVLEHDIGSYAGAYASKRHALVFHERTVGSARVWFAQKAVSDGHGGRTTRTSVTFPDSDCANFYTYSSEPEATAAVKFIANNARPRSLGSPGRSCDSER
jgi:hypothetical protein